MVQSDEIEVYNQTVRPLKLRAEEGTNRGKVRQMVKDDLAQLYIQAAEVRDNFNSFLRAIGEKTRATVDLPDELKNISRVFEKIMFDPDNQGSCEKIADIVRAMLSASSMKMVAEIVMAFLESDEVVIVRVKDRFVEKASPGGWRDLMINFYMANDQQRFVCEVQVVLEKMLVARKGLGGHDGYDQSRNAREVLERLGALDPAKRWERAAHLREVDCVGAPELVHLGYEVKDMLKAGYEASEIRGQEGVSDDVVTRAEEEIARELEAQKAPVSILDRAKDQRSLRRQVSLGYRETSRRQAFDAAATWSSAFGLVKGKGTRKLNSIRIAPKRSREPETGLEPKPEHEARPESSKLPTGWSRVKTKFATLRAFQDGSDSNTGLS